MQSQSSDPLNQSQSPVCATGTIGLWNYLENSLVKKYGEQNRKNIDRYLSRSVNTIMRDLVNIFISPMEHTYFVGDDSIKVIQLNSYEQSWGRMTIDGKKLWANTELKHILFDVQFEGKTGIATGGRIRSKVMDSLMEHAIEESEDENWKVELNFDFDEQDVFGTPVDSERLRQELKLWEIEFPYKNGKEKDKTLRYIAMTKIILASLTNGELLQEMIVKPSGRIYFKGLNLQTAPKAVRHAALGKCHLYDMRVGAFGVMGGLAKQYAKELGLEVSLHNIKGYIKNKDEYRMRVTKYIYPEETKDFKKLEQFKAFFGFYNVKNALTAIGFGAKRNVNAVWKDHNDKWCATSINKAFKNNKDEAERFINCNLINDLLDEYVECTKVVELRLEQDEEFAAFFNLTEDMNRGQKLAMVYQTMETKIMSSFMDIVGVENVLLPVHDGAYIKYKIDYASVWYKLVIPFIGDKDFIQLDHTRYGLADISNESAHAMFIAEQEEVARTYMSPTMVGGAVKKRQVQTPWGMMDADLYEQHQTDDEYFQEGYFKDSVPKS